MWVGGLAISLTFQSKTGQLYSNVRAELIDCQLRAGLLEAHLQSLVPDLQAASAQSKSFPAIYAETATATVLKQRPHRLFWRGSDVK